MLRREDACCRRGALTEAGEDLYARYLARRLQAKQRFADVPGGIEVPVDFAVHYLDLAQRSTERNRWRQQCLRRVSGSCARFPRLLWRSRTSQHGDGLAGPVLLRSRRSQMELR